MTVNELRAALTLAPNDADIEVLFGGDLEGTPITQVLIDEGTIFIVAG